MWKTCNTKEKYQLANVHPIEAHRKVTERYIWCNPSHTSGQLLVADISTALFTSGRPSVGEPPRKVLRPDPVVAQSCDRRVTPCYGPGHQSKNRSAAGTVRSTGERGTCPPAEAPAHSGSVVATANGVALPGPGGGSLTAVPEPASVVLFGFGGVMLALRRVRRRPAKR